MNTKICPTCKTPIPAHAPGGFCPACILRDADELPPLGRMAPSLAEVSAAFPQLEVLALIGQGGMGFVYKVRQPSLDRTVALKILSPELGRDPAFAERFDREARVLGKLNHPNIVTVFESGVVAATPSSQTEQNAAPGIHYYYLIMEFVDGVNLRQAMRAGRFTPQQALAVVPGICDALQAAHAQGVWHRDIKPENILLDAQGGVKIVDFGIARLVGDPRRDFTLTVTGAALGSAAYMAPEQHEKPHDVDHRADIYSLGVVIYEMLTGELPLGRFKAPSTKAAVDARIDEIVFRTLEKERELRQQSADEVKTDVTNATSRGSARPSAAWSGEPKSGTPFALASKAAFLGGIVLFIAAVVFTYGSTQGVLLTIASTAFVLGALGLQFGNGTPSIPNPADASPITVRSLWLFLGGLTALIAGLVVYNDAPHVPVHMSGLQMRPVMMPDPSALTLGRFLIAAGSIAAFTGWCGLWYALSMMKRGAISTTLCGVARTCAWLPVAFLVIAAVIWPVRRVESEQAEFRAARRAAEQHRNDAQTRYDAETAQAQLKTKFPDFSTPQGAVVAYEMALESGDTADVLAAIPRSVVGKAVRPGDYAKELIAKHRAGKVTKEDEAILIFVGTPENGPRIGTMDVESQKRILGSDPVGSVIVDRKARLFGKNPGVQSITQTCVKEGLEWRVIPNYEPSLKIATPTTPANPDAAFSLEKEK